VEKAKRIIPAVYGALGLVVGCLAAYFVLGFLWTRIVVKPVDVTAHDADIVFALSIIAGIITGSFALLASAHRYWNPQNRSLDRPVS
jgi:nitrate reductase gamma subunit